MGYGCGCASLRVPMHNVPYDEFDLFEFEKYFLKIIN
jgi:hypothetical protein